MAVASGEELYGLPLDQFVPERSVLARLLRDRGERDEATRVGKLRKPSVAAWAVNQLVRTQQKQVAELFDAGDAARQAQSDLLAGKGGAAALRDAGSRERNAVQELIKAARGLLTSGGHELSPGTLERVSDTLHAAALDTDAREQIRGGCLERELRHVGVAFAASGATGAPSRPKKVRMDATKAARAAEERARRATQRADQALEEAEKRRARAAAALREAEQAVAQARELARASAEEHKRRLAELGRK